MNPGVSTAISEVPPSVLAKRSVEGISLAQSPSYRLREDALRHIDDWIATVGPRAQQLYQKKRGIVALQEPSSVPSLQREQEHQRERQGNKEGIFGEQNRQETIVDEYARVQLGHIPST